MPCLWRHVSMAGGKQTAGRGGRVDNLQYLPYGSRPVAKRLMDMCCSTARLPAISTANS